MNKEAFVGLPGLPGLPGNMWLYGKGADKLWDEIRKTVPGHDYEGYDYLGNVENGDQLIKDVGKDLVSNKDLPVYPDWFPGSDNIKEYGTDFILNSEEGSRLARNYINSRFNEALEKGKDLKDTRLFKDTFSDLSEKNREKVYRALGDVVSGWSGDKPGKFADYVSGSLGEDTMKKIEEHEGGATDYIPWSENLIRNHGRGIAIENLKKILKDNEHGGKILENMSDDQLDSTLKSYLNTDEGMKVAEYYTDKYINEKLSGVKDFLDEYKVPIIAALGIPLALMLGKGVIGMFSGGNQRREPRRQASYGRRPRRQPAGYSAPQRGWTQEGIYRG